MIWKLLRTMSQNLTLTIPVMMVAGFIFGIFMDAAFLKSLIIPFTFLMVYPMMVTLNIQKVFEGGDVKAQVLTQAINFGVVPFLAYFMGLIFFKDQPYMALGLLLAGLVPTSGMTISWTGFAKGNLAAAVKMTVIGLTLGSIATPFYVRMLMGTTIEIDMVAVFKQIVVIVFIPMAAGYLTRRALVKKHGEKGFKTSVGPKFPPLSTLGVVGIVFIAMALKARAIAAAPSMLAYILIPLVIIYGFNFTFSSIIGKKLLPRGDAIALVYGSVMRNLSIALAIAINAFGKQGASAALVVAVAYIIQVQSAAWYVKLTDRIFGRAPLDGAQPSKPTPQAKTEPIAETVEEPEGSMVANIQKILFATDITPTAKYAARYACTIGNKFNAKVWAIHVVPDLLAEYSAGAGVTIKDPEKQEEFNRDAVENAERMLGERIRNTSEKVIKEISACPLSKDRIMVKTGDPVEEITQAAAQGDFDLIIMGTHGDQGFDDILLGSTAQGVIHASKIPVLVARPA
ncbi:universal stress protein [uncultured Desulfobacter sp.]|uniref:universal stress protein n=1 Tax=uncultured Desulfobacter sp. TaxID=240139 RepID=UPI0029F56C25|nr:universal stress protein [uncultured Desulfobacter sp.]